MVTSRFKRWLVKVNDELSPTGEVYMVVEDFPPEEGNANWHVAQWDRFYKGTPDVSEGDCPPGDWRDILPLEGFDNGLVEDKHERASTLDAQGIPAGKSRGMAIIPYEGQRRSYNNRGGTKQDIAVVDQTHRVTQGGSLGCVATARMIVPREGTENYRPFIRRMRDSGHRSVRYTAVWHRAFVWYQVKEVMGNYPEIPNSPSSLKPHSSLNAPGEEAQPPIESLSRCEDQSD